MKKQKFWVAISVVILAGALILLRPTREKDASQLKIVRVGYLPITHSLPLVVADSLNKGGFKKFELELVKFSSWPELTEALNSGQIQGAITMLEIAIVGHQRGIPLKILALSHRNGDVLVASKNVASLRELRGKVVAIPHRLSGHNILLHKALTRAGLKYEDVQKVEMAPPDMPGALARGEVAAYIVAEPFGARSVVGGTGRVLLRAQDIWPDWICCGFVMNASFVKANPEVIQELAEALVKAGKFIEENKEETIEIAQNYMQIEKKLWEQALGWIDYSNLVPNKRELGELQNSMLELPWEGKTHTLLASRINIDELLDTTFVEKASREVK